MGRKLHTYKGAHVEVTYDAGRCIHAARCVQGLPEVFDPERRPWIEPDRAPDSAALVRTIEACPTGALKYVRPGAPEKPVPDATISVHSGGPLYLKGKLRIEDSYGDVIHEGTRVALCRCGASADKPFCDGSHVRAGFTGE